MTSILADGLSSSIICLHLLAASRFRQDNITVAPKYASVLAVSNPTEQYILTVKTGCAEIILCVSLQNMQLS